MKAKKLLAALMAMTFVVGCTKARKAKFADDETASATYAIAELQNIKVQATTQAAEEVSAQSLEAKRAKIAKTNASSRVNALLVGLEITGKPATTYDLLLTVSSDHLTIFKTVQNENDLTMSERPTAYRNNGTTYVPVAKISVQGYGVIERAKNANGERTSNLVMKSVPFAQASHVKIDLNSDNVMAVDQEYANLIRIHDIKNKEFLFRRTYSKSSNTFGFSPGFSGNVDVVRLELKKDRLGVRKVLHAKGESNAPEENREEIMTVPAQYFKREQAKGNLPTKFIPTTFEQAEYVQVNWNSERSTYHSPLEGVNANCIRSQVVTIDKIDNRLEEGVLSFTKLTSATVAPECATEFERGPYNFDHLEQRNFEFEERLSFKTFDKAKFVTPAEDLPYSAQTALGFGFFTGYRTEPDQYGNSGFKDNRKAMPRLMDFSKGKVVRFVLGGLDRADEDVRKTIIASAKEVVADWNNTFKYAFHGSELQRSGPYIELLVDGEDIKKGELGDLDRHYLWNFTDSYESSILGLGQAAQNPITGRVESANVLMYPGNIISGIGYKKRMAETKAAYEKFKQTAAQRAQQAASGQTVAQQPARSNDTTAKVTEFRSLFHLQPTNLRQSLNKVKAVSTADLRSVLNSSAATAKAKLNAAVTKATSDMFLGRILDKAAQQKLLSNPVALEALVAEELLAAAQVGELGELNSSELQAMTFEAKQKALRLGFTKQVESYGGCLYHDHMDAAPASAADQDMIASLKNTYKWALSHEFGHVFGLTHNFKASFDKDNFKFPGEEKTNRVYSSVMDYVDTDIVQYAGLGPYDAHAVRAAYTGRIELKDGKLMTLAQVKQALKLDSWWNLNAGHLAGSKVKTYLYCNDFEAEEDPTCTRHDLGTSYTELITRKIENYKSDYSWRNHRGDRTTYGSPFNYIYRILHTMTDIRKINDETVLKIMTDQSQLADLLCAQRKAKNFFLEVIGTPTTSLSFDDPDRFQVIEADIVKFDASGCAPVADSNGQAVIEKKNIIVEAKSLDDQAIPGSDSLPGYSSLQTRGIQIDKVFATQMLTRRRLGMPRYAERSIEVSFADFDNIFFEANNVESNLVLNILNQTLADRSMGIYANGLQLVQLPSHLEVKQNSLTRGYTLLATSVLLESDRSQGQSNLATHFRTGSTRNAENRMAVSYSDLKLEDVDQMKYYALSNATAAKELVTTAAARRLLLDNADSLNEILKEGLTADTKEKADAFLTKFEAKIEELNKSGLIINDDMKERGLDAKMLSKFLFGNAFEVLAIIEQIVPKMANQQEGPMYLAQAREIGLEKSAVIKNSLPILGLMNRALQEVAFPAPKSVDEKDKDAVAKEQMRRMSVNLLNILIPGGVIQSQHDAIVDNLSQLNQYFQMLRPELNNK